MADKNKKGIRLNRFLSMCGICSRRKADELIINGLIKINNKTINTLGHIVFSEDKVFFKGREILPERKKYILLNKPTGYITTMKDERGRQTVMSLIKDACKERLVPVGRLDKQTTGLLLFTNDGILAKKMTHPRYQVKKTYQLLLDKPLKKIDFLNIIKGLKLPDGFVMVDAIKYINSDHRKIQIELHVGKNRIVRRLFSFIGYTVIELDRTGYAFLTQKNLPLGKWRALTLEELSTLQQET